MSEQTKQFDFFKEEDKASYEQLPEDEKVKIAEVAQDEAIKIQEIINNIDYENFDFNLLSEIPAQFHQDIAFKFIEAGYGYFVAFNLKKFEGLNQNIAIKLIEGGFDSEVADNLKKFQGIDYNIALKLIKDGSADYLVNNLEKFKELNQEVAFGLIKIGEGHVVAENIKKFQCINHYEIALRLIENNLGGAVAINLDKFSGLNRQNIEDIAFKLIEIYHGGAVAENLDKFLGINHQDIAIKLIKANFGGYVIKYLEKFQGLNHSDIALKMIEARQGESVEYNLEKFQGLNQEVALKLIKFTTGDRILYHLEKFQGLNHSDIALKLIEAGKGVAVVDKLEKLQGLNHADIALKLIEAGKGEFISYHLEKFQGLNHSDIAIKLVNAGKGDSVAENLEKFQGLNHQDIILKLIAAGRIISVANNLEKFLGINQNIVLKVVIELMYNGNLDFALVVKNKFQSPGITKDDVFKIVKNKVLDNIDDNVYEKLFDSQALNYIESLKKFGNEHGLKLSEVCYYKESKVEDEESAEGEKMEENELHRKIYELLKDNHSDWQDQENIIIPFEAGASLFGYDKMFKYLARQELTRHDGLHNFLQIIKSYEASGLKAPAYYNNILEQVARDDAEYYEGTAHHHLNSLVSSISYDFDGLAEKTKEYSGIEKLQNLMIELGDITNIFASWKNLKKYREVCELLGRTEILENLQNLKKEGKDKLYKYIGTLAFHPNISMEEVFKLWNNPESFLQNNDSHTPEGVHDRKKPSNYIEIPNLDLTATELRDALVEGVYDRLQVFTPMEIIYQVGRGEKIDIKKDLARQIGVRDKELRKKLGINEDEKLESNQKLFSRLRQIFKARGYDLRRYLNSEEEIDEAFSGELEQFRLKQEADEYRVKINKKSDPDGVVAGNDTACCMPFGSGKNNVYTFNPICALFTVQKKNADGTFRTVSQSVLTLDKDINENVADLLSKLSSVEAKLHEIVNEDVLLGKPSIITCDNVELAENYKSHTQAGQILEQIYRDFFQEYVKKYSTKQNLDTSKVIIGQGYSDSLKHLPVVNNTFVPEAPVGYSDNLQAKAYLLDLNKEVGEKLIVDKKISSFSESEQKIETHANWPRGTSYLTYRDSLPVAYIEGKAYHDNESLIQYLHNMENALIAKDVNNEAKGRANMSFKYQDSDGKIHGYLLAYEGQRNNNLYSDEEHEIKEKVLYVTDLASDGNKRAGGSLLLVFSEEYRKNYLEKNNPIPIYMQLRETTSYPIIVKQLDKLTKDTGYKFHFEELGTYKHGHDTMHEAIVRTEKI